MAVVAKALTVFQSLHYTQTEWLYCVSNICFAGNGKILVLSFIKGEIFKSITLMMKMFKQINRGISCQAIHACHLVW